MSVDPFTAASQSYINANKTNVRRGAVVPMADSREFSLGTKITLGVLLAFFILCVVNFAGSFF